MDASLLTRNPTSFLLYTILLLEYSQRAQTFEEFKKNHTLTLNSVSPQQMWWV